MEAITLTKKEPKQGTKGSSPTQAAHSIYDKLNNRKYGGGAFYVRGHLLNDNVHGPGKWENMTPLSVDGNKNHLLNVEDKVKAGVSSGAVLKYTVIPNYTRSSAVPSDESLKIAKIEPANWPKIIAIKEAEKHVPTSLSCDVSLMEEKNGSYTPKKSLVKTTVDNPVDQSLGSYQIDSAQIQKVNLSKDTAEHIASNAGIFIDQAKEIKTAVAAIKVLNYYADLKAANNAITDDTISQLTKRPNVVLK